MSIIKVLKKASNFPYIDPIQIRSLSMPEVTRLGAK